MCDVWTLETVLANHPAPAHGRHMFEVALYSDHLLKVGWSTAHAVFDPELHVGVGLARGTFGCDVDTALTGGPRKV